MGNGFLSEQENLQDTMRDLWVQVTNAQVEVSRRVIFILNINHLLSSLL